MPYENEYGWHVRYETQVRWYQSWKWESIENLKNWKVLWQSETKMGLTKFIILDKVHFVLDMYCIFFSITAAMDTGFHLSGSKNSNLTLRRNPTTIFLINSREAEVVN